MSKKQRRTKEKNNVQNKSKLNKAYYWVIAVLFIILFLLVIFIFAKNDNKVNLDNSQSSSEQVEEESTVDSNKKNQPEDEGKDKESSDNVEKEEESDEESEEEKSEKDTNENSDSTEDDDGKNVVNKDAPHDKDYSTDFNNGSNDRLEIKKEIMKATGLGNDLIEYWVGNNGPGRVSATVTSSDESEVYEVHLQYGDGSWHVTDYKALDSIPDDFN